MLQLHWSSNGIEGISEDMPSTSNQLYILITLGLYAPGFFGRDTLELVKRAKYKKCCAGARLFKDYSYKMLLGLLSGVNAYQSGCIPARIYTVLNA